MYIYIKTIIFISLYIHINYNLLTLKCGPGNTNSSSVDDSGLFIGMTVTIMSHGGTHRFADCYGLNRVPSKLIC